MNSQRKKLVLATTKNVANEFLCMPVFSFILLFTFYAFIFFGYFVCFIWMIIDLLRGKGYKKYKKVEKEDHAAECPDYIETPYYNEQYDGGEKDDELAQ